LKVTDNLWETIQDRDNKKLIGSHNVADGMAQIPVTESDLEGHFSIAF